MDSRSSRSEKSGAIFVTKSYLKTAICGKNGSVLKKTVSILQSGMLSFDDKHALHESFKGVMVRLKTHCTRLVSTTETEFMIMISNGKK